MAEKRPVKIVETVLRDAHQSLIATRMKTEEMLPIIDKMDKVGYYAVESVSYTHLDVYKRQVFRDGKLLQPELGIYINREPGGL